jgi:hypothetical protein
MSAKTARRFSKATLLEHVEAQMMVLADEWGIDPGNGTAQIAPGDIDRAVAYGEYRALDDLRDRLNGFYYDDAWMTYDDADAAIARRAAEAQA